MKQLTIIFDSGIEASMVELLDGLGVTGITWIHDVKGAGGRGVKLNSPVFPGTNHIALIVLPREHVARVQAAVRRLQAGYRLKPGVTMLCQEVEVLD